MTIFEWLEDAKRELEVTLQLKVTDDPAKVSANSIFIDVPRITNATLNGYQMEVDFWLVGGGQANKVSRDWLLENVFRFVDAIGTAQAEPIPYRGEIPAFRSTLTFTMKG